MKGGLAGSVAMAVLACAYGVLKAGSIWYPDQSARGSPSIAQSLKLGPAQLNSFHADSFAIALVLHVLVSTARWIAVRRDASHVARRPIVLGGLIAPVLWSGLLYTISRLLNPMLESHIDWFWFIASQVAFGIVAGLVVVRQASDADARERVVCYTRRNRSSRNHAATRETERSADEAAFRYLSAFAALGVYCSRLAALPTANLRRVRSLWRRTKFWNSALSTQRTAPAATVRKDVEARRWRSPIRSTSPLSTKNAMRKVIANGVRGTVDASVR